jgi:hypothetical protein
MVASLVMAIARVGNKKRDSCTEEIWRCCEGQSDRLRADMEAIHNGGKEVVESVGSVVRAKEEYLEEIM